MKRIAILVAGFVLALVICQFGVSKADAKRPTCTGQSCPPSTYGYLFDDEFSGAVGSPPDPAKWWATPWCASGADNTQFCYNKANAYLDGLGGLKLVVTNGTMGRAYDGAQIQTFVESGWPPTTVLWSHYPPIRIEVRASFAPGSGLWGAIWTNANTSGGSANLELDIQEFRGAVATEDTCHTHGPVEWGAVINTGTDLSVGWHTYWTNYYFDHAVFGVDSLTCGSVATPSQPEMIRLDHIVGVPGTWGGMGGPPPAWAIPAIMLVDYVRVTAL